MRLPWQRQGVASGLVVALALLLGTVGFIPVLAMRVSSESANNTVELVADWEEFETLALRENMSMPEVLAALAGSGITSIAVPETTPDRLVRLGEATLLSGADLQARIRQTGTLAPVLAGLAAAGDIDPRWSYLLFSDEEIFAQARDAACRRVGGNCRTWSDGNTWLLEVPVNQDSFRKMGLGIWQRDLLAVKEHGLMAIPRFADYPGITPDDIAGAFSQVVSVVDVGSVIFSGSAVLGFAAGDAGIKETARQLNRYQLAVGLIESADLLGHFPQQGMDNLLQHIDYRAARVYSIPPDYLARLRPAEAVDIWVRSPQERNIRILYLRPLYSNSEDHDHWTVTLSTFERLAQRLEERGWQLGRAATFPPYDINPLWQVLLLTGIGGLLLAVVCRFISLPLVAQLAVPAGVVGGFLGLARLIGQDPAREAAALLVAVVAPVWVMDNLLSGWALRAAGRSLSTGPVLATAVFEAARAFAMMIWCSFVLAALLGDINYLLEVRYFRGVKLSFVLPPVLALAAYWWRFGVDGKPDAGTTGGRQRLKRRINGLIQLLWAEVRWRHLLVGVVLAVAAVLYVLRSGNLTQEFVPEYELMLRQLLEDWLGARPRFKEFIIGYPALMIGVWLLNRRMYGYVWPTVVGGVVGMVSIINSFEHLRTPVLVSLLRSFNGLWLGLVVGLVAVIVLEVLWQRWEAVWKPRFLGEGPLDR